MVAAEVLRQTLSGPQELAGIAVLMEHVLKGRQYFAVGAEKSDFESESQPVFLGSATSECSHGDPPAQERSR